MHLINIKNLQHILILIFIFACCGCENSHPTKQKKMIPANLDKQEFPERRFHSVTEFKGLLWSTGGEDRNADLHNDVWVSDDGVYWAKIKGNAEFSARAEHKLIAFRNKLWLIGGTDSKGVSKSDIWSSSDGITWKLELDNAPFEGRYGVAIVAHNKKLHLVGGYTRESGAKAIYRNDIWISSNGIDWTLEKENAEFSERSYHQMFHHKGKVFLIGGYGKGSPNAEIWTSDDGLTWLNMEVSDPSPTRQNFKAISYNNRIYIIGGRERNRKPKHLNWMSKSGEQWESIEKANFLGKRIFHEVIEYDNKLWVIGGNLFWTREVGMWPERVVFTTDMEDWKSAQSVIEKNQILKREN